ncbi:NADH-ubiquinone oxido 9.5 kDa subunit [Cyphellophora attinorum]|uniref:NADH-ubiquinone oxido 9.5 kDa subunit n=1 Tax=Cyphellophora attinorum TaxID=1664694 RepID=A0A0N1HBC3_9EURO|nr:NADH-ubiquinone oxido 9.5 kDa subunit [Phialophora attinorum]KPI41592.1 NADH-ubiquinone oxido 9.5 kDa subunit [Phialophora attinorum]
MSGIPQTFFSSPLRYIRWAFHEKPAIAWSMVLGGMGPPLLYALPKVRRRFGDEDPPEVPHSYPAPISAGRNPFDPAHEEDSMPELLALPPVSESQIKLNIT